MQGLNELRWINKKSPETGRFLLAGGKGFEPLLNDPESFVLPLDEPPKLLERAIFYHAHGNQARNLLTLFCVSTRSPTGIILNIEQY